MNKVTVIGGGLAGVEACYQLAKRGVTVDLYEMRPVKTTPAHKTGDFAELVCSNSLKSADVNTAGILIIGVMYERSTINAPSDWLFVKPVDSSIRVIMALSIMLVIGIIDAPIVTGTAMRMRLERTYLNPIGRKLLRTDICAANFFLFVL